MIDNNIVVWGLGNHARKKIIPSIINSKEYNLFGVCSRNTRLIKSVSAELNCFCWSDPITMLNTENFNTVFISTPIGTHFKFSKMALESNKNVICEKPLTCDFHHTKTLIELAKKNKKMLAEAFMFLYHPQFINLKKILKNNELGKIHSVNCRFGIPSLENPGFRNDANLGGGAFWDVGSYTVAAVLELFNYQNVKVLFSQLSFHKDSKLDIQGRATLQFSEGPFVNLEWAVGVSYVNEIDLWGDLGSLYTDKIFSKPIEYHPVYKLRDIHGIESFIHSQKSNQFEEMFKVFAEKSDYQLKIESEYERIYMRASIMDAIFNLSN